MHIETPFNIGDTYWLPTMSPRQVVEPCPVCNTATLVTVLAGGLEYQVECEACRRGYEGPHGYVTEYHYDPHAEPFTIARVARLESEGWVVEEAKGKSVRFNDLRATEAEALEVSKAAYRAQEEYNMRQRAYQRKGVSKATWSVKYHNDAIKKLERELVYHRSKLQAKKVATRDRA